MKFKNTVYTVDNIEKKLAPFDAKATREEHSLLDDLRMAWDHDTDHDPENPYITKVDIIQGCEKMVPFHPHAQQYLSKLMAALIE